MSVIWSLVPVPDILLNLRLTHGLLDGETSMVNSQTSLKLNNNIAMCFLHNSSDVEFINIQFLKLILSSYEDIQSIGVALVKYLRSHHSAKT